MYAPGRLLTTRKPARFRIRCDAATRPLFRTAHAAATDWRDGYLTVTMVMAVGGTI